MEPNINISVYDASLLTGISINEYFSYIKSKQIESRVYLPKDKAIKDEKLIELAKKTTFSISYLKPSYQLQYLLQLFDSNQLNIDLIYLYRKNKAKYNKLLNVIKIVSNYFDRNQKYYISNNITSLSSSYLNKYHLNIKTIYEIASELSLDGYHFLYKKNHYKQYYSICSAVKDFINSEFIYYQKTSNIEAFNNLVNEKNILGASFCENCPHNPNNILHTIFELETRKYYPTCEFATCLDNNNNGLIIPKDPSTISRFKNDINKS